MMSLEFIEACNALINNDIMSLKQQIQQNPAILTEQADTAAIKGLSLLHYAFDSRVDEKTLKIVLDALVTHKKLADAITKQDQSGSTPLHLAARSKEANLAVYLSTLSDAGWVANALAVTDNHGFTPIHIAALTMKIVGTRVPNFSLLKSFSETRVPVSEVKSTAPVNPFTVMINAIIADDVDTLRKHYSLLEKPIAPYSISLIDLAKNLGQIKCLVFLANGGFLDNNLFITNLPNERNIFHLFAEIASDLELLTILQKADDLKKLDKAYYIGDSSCSTPLHIAAKRGDRKVIVLLLDFSPKRAAKACRMTDNQRTLPLSLYNYSFNDDSVLIMLEKATLEYDFKPLSELVTEEEMFERFPDMRTDDTEINKAFKNFVKAINHARKLFTFSQTHYSANATTVSTDEYRIRTDKILELTNKLDAQKVTQFSNEVINTVSEYKEGNCEHFAIVCAGQLKKIDPSLVIHVKFLVKPGDHVWLEVEVKDKKFFVDAWSGVFGPTEHERNIMMDCQYYEDVPGHYPRHRSVGTFLNSQQKIAYSHTVKLSPSDVATPSTEGFFASSLPKKSPALQNKDVTNESKTYQVTQTKHALKDPL